MEMSEERIGQRIDANLFDVPIQKISGLTRDVMTRKIDAIRAKGVGRLLIKEYPTASAHVGHFRALLNELKLKRKFVPDIIIVDYLNICASSRMKVGGAVNSYNMVKSIAEELRGLGVEYNVPILSAVQGNRSSFNNSDIGMENTADSIGIVLTADLLIALISTEELDKLNQIMVKQLKNRYNDLNNHKRFVVGIDKSKMKLFDLEESAQTFISDVPASSPAAPTPSTTDVNRLKRKTGKFDNIRVDDD
jgi:replicative DNA helicase